jgi:hypothetical protein
MLVPPGDTSRGGARPGELIRGEDPHDRVRYRQPLSDGSRVVDTFYASPSPEKTGHGHIVEWVHRDGTRCLLHLRDTYDPTVHGARQAAVLHDTGIKPKNLWVDGATQL